MHYFIRAKKLDFLFNRHLQFILYIQPMFDKRKFLRALELAQHFACTALMQAQSQDKRKRKRIEYRLQSVEICETQNFQKKLSQRKSIIKNKCQYN